MGCYDQYQYSTGVEYIYRDDANNRTRVRLYANVYAGCWYYISYGTDAYFHIDVQKGNIEGMTSWTPWSIGRPTQTSLNGNNQWTRVWTSSDYWMNHDANGELRFRTYGNFESWGTYGTPTLWSDSGEIQPFYDYNRSAIQASAPSVSRSANGGTLYMSVGDPGAYNSGPQRDFDWQYHSLGGGWADLDATGDPSQSVGVDPNTTYYARVIAYNSDGNNGWSGESVASYGVPTVPLLVSAAKSDSVAGRIKVWWNPPSYTGAGVDYYHIYRNDIHVGTWNSGTPPTSSAPFNDDGLARNSTNTYKIYAHNSTGWSNVSSGASAIAPGVPGAPTLVASTELSPNPSRIGRNVTVRANKDANPYGNAVTEYRIQYATSDDSYATWYGWNGTSGVLNAYNPMNIAGTEATFTYSMLTAAKTYKFRVYAVNATGAGNLPADAVVLATPFFLPASGKKWNGTSWDPTAVAKRWTGASWEDISTAKRYTTVGAATTGSGTTGNVVSSKGYYTRLSHTWSYNSSTEVLTISGEYILGAGSTYFSGYQLSGSLTVNNQAIWSPSGNYSIGANSEITLTTFNLVIPKASILYSSIPITSSIQMTQQGLAWSLPLIASSLTPQVINGTWVELT